jgi:hypothetical protein
VAIKKLFYLTQEEYDLLERSGVYYGLSIPELARQMIWTALELKELVLARVDSVVPLLELRLEFRVPESIDEGWDKLCQAYPLRKQNKRHGNDGNFCFRQFLWYLPKRDTKDGEVLDIMIDRPTNWHMWDL